MEKSMSKGKKKQNCCKHKNCNNRFDCLDYVVPSASIPCPPISGQNKSAAFVCSHKKKHCREHGYCFQCMQSNLIEKCSCYLANIRDDQYQNNFSDKKQERFFKYRNQLFQNRKGKLK